VTRTPTGALALAAAIAALSGEELRALLHRRRILSPRSVGDPLGLAIELLRAESIQHALRALDRRSLDALQVLGGQGLRNPEQNGLIDDLRGLGLVGLETGGRSIAVVPLPEVTASLRELTAPPGVAAAPGSEGDRPKGAAARDADTASWFGPALASVSRSAAILRALMLRSVRLSRKGTVTVVAQRELAGFAHDSPEHAAALVQALRLARLAVPSTSRNGQEQLEASRRAAEWLSLDYPSRWVALSEALVSAAPHPLRRTIALGAAARGSGSSGGPEAIDLAAASGPILRREFPLLPQADLDAADEWRGLAELLGCSVDGWLVPAALELLNGDRDAALAAAHRDFPAPAAGVYLQPDLSLIVPGPLAPDDEAALTAIARTEQLGVATSLRLSEDTLTQALHAGLALGEIRSLLERLSLTGMPQPLDYLLGDLERRQLSGRLPEPHRLGARTATEPARDRIAASAPPSSGSIGEAELEELAQRVESAAASGAGSGDLTRKLELAIRHRSTVRITATAGRSDATERTFTLQPVSLAAGRLRATDPSAGVERTLPLSAIVRVEAH